MREGAERLMGVSVAEYLGERVDFEATISPAQTGAKCPFMNRHCDKVAKSKPPICSVRKPDGTLWITCEHRLCSTRSKNEKKQDIRLTQYQNDILWEIASNVYRGVFCRDDIGIKREVNIPLPNSSGYKGDFVMRNFAAGAKVDELIVEMQGGGETSSTGSITRLIESWEKSPSNKKLGKPTKAGTIETNAWRRQQEQFLVKGNVVTQTGGKIVFVVGGLLYDYLLKKFQEKELRDLEKHNWTLCILGIVEDKSQNPTLGRIPLMVDQEKKLFTNYATFVRLLTDQGAPIPEIFEGDFLTLTGRNISV